MKFTSTPIPGVWIIDPVRYGDARGYFCETFKLEEFRKATGFDTEFVQDNESLSRRGVLRGLHYQAASASQAKLVRVSEGRVVDVAVDLRRESPAFGQHVMVELSSENGRQMFIPRGFAHGFLVLSESARFQYKVDNVYCPSAERCIRFDDPGLAVRWPEVEGGYIFSEKDMAGGSFAEAELF